MMNADKIMGVLSPSEYAALSLRALYACKGYTQYKMSKFEEYDLYSGNKDFLVSGSVITFTDTDGRLMALKPDVTLSIIKNTADVPDGQSRLFYNENVYRVARGTNSFKEIPQAGVEVIGEVDGGVLVEVLTLALESINMLADEFVLEVSSLDLIAAVCEALGISEKQRVAIYDALAAKNIDALTIAAKSCNLDEKQTAVLKKLTEIYGDLDNTIGRLDELKISDAAGLVVDEFKDVLTKLNQSPLAKYASVDFSVINDGAYYNGIAFRGFAFGVAQRVLSGGQYDKFMKKMGKSSSAVGFAVYLDEISRAKEGKNG